MGINVITCTNLFDIADIVVTLSLLFSFGGTANRTIHMTSHWFLFYYGLGSKRRTCCATQTLLLVNDKRGTTNAARKYQSIFYEWQEAKPAMASAKSSRWNEKMMNLTNQRRTYGVSMFSFAANIQENLFIYIIILSCDWHFCVRY